MNLEQSYIHISEQSTQTMNSCANVLIPTRQGGNYSDIAT